MLLGNAREARDVCGNLCRVGKLHLIVRPFALLPV